MNWPSAEALRFEALIEANVCRGGASQEKALRRADLADFLDQFLETAICKNSDAG